MSAIDFWKPILLGATWGIAAGNASADTNLLPNGDFSNAQQLAGWQPAPPGASFTWKSDDSALDSNSGSMEVGSSMMGEHVVSQCFHVNPSAPYTFGMQYRVSSGGPGFYMICQAYATGTCDSASLIVYLGNSAGAAYSTSWANWGPFSGTLPANAIAVNCDVVAYANGLGGTIRFDNVYFNSAAATPVELETFDIH